MPGAWILAPRRWVIWGSCEVCTGVSTLHSKWGEEGFPLESPQCLPRVFLLVSGIEFGSWLFRNSENKLVALATAGSP